MNLDPTVSPWIGILASTGVCLWMAAIGVPLAHAVFRDRPRLVWPFYAPALGIVTVLLVTNLSAYVIPGAPSAWFGLLAPSALAAIVAWRDRQICLPSPRTATGLGVLLAASAGIFAFALANRTQQPFIDEAWHFALSRLLANGVFPPTTPYGPSAGIGYHYGHNLLAAAILNTAAVPAWTSLFIVVSFLVVVLMLAAAGFAWDLGASLPMAGGIGATVGFFQGSVRVGLPPYVDSNQPVNDLAGFLAGLAPLEPQLAFAWLQLPQQALAIVIVILIAAALQVGATRGLLAMAAASGMSALADASVMIFGGAALGIIGAVCLVRSRGSERFVLGGCLVASAMLVVFAGGPISDALFDRGGTAEVVRLAFDPNPAAFLPADLEGLLWARVGIVSLVAVSAIAAFSKRSLGLAYLTVAAALGLVEAQILQSALEFNDGRISRLAACIAMLAALTGGVALLQALRDHRRTLASLAVALFVLLPTGLPGAIAGVHFGLRGFQIDPPASESGALPLVGDLHMQPELAANWDFYAWLGQFVPADTRLLTTHPGLSASVAGVVSPTSGGDVQMLSANTLPVYADALRFLHRDDLAAMAVTHLHVTDRLEEGMSPSARSLLGNPAHFKLLAERRSVSGQRHRIYAVTSGAGTPTVAPSSYRSLREVVPVDAPVILLGRLTTYQRRMILFTFIDRDNLWRTDFVNLDRATRIPRAALLTSQVPNRGVVVLAERMEPTLLGLSRSDAIWAGDGMRAYDLTHAWSPVWRLPQDDVALSQHQRAGCEPAADSPAELQLLGNPGSVVGHDGLTLNLTGTPQRFRVSASICEQVVLRGAGAVAPFAQARPYRSASQPLVSSVVAGLGFDGASEGGLAIINLWYRNPQRHSFVTGSEFRVYESDQAGVTPLHLNPLSSIRWWPGPLVLSAETQMARIEFDAHRLEINGSAGAGGTAELKPGWTYLLMLNIAGANPESGLAEVLQQVPLLRVVVGEAGVSYETLSGVLAIDSRQPGVQMRRLPSFGSISKDVDFTPASEMADSSGGRP